MYQNIFVTQRSTNAPSMVYLWDDVAGVQVFPYQQFDYAYREDKFGGFMSLYGKKLKKVANQYGATDLIESDLPRETRVLTDLYLDSDDVSSGHVLGIFDIEVDSEGAFPDLMLADKEITAISFCNYETKEYKCYILDPVGIITDTDVIVSCRSEIQLIEEFFIWYTKQNFTILTGWNCNGFDVPYLYRRISRVMGIETAVQLSPVNLVKYNERREQYFIAGVSCLDYFDAYKKFRLEPRQNYRLGYIGELEVGIKKVDFDGTLAELFKNDKETYIEYNLTDVKIVEAFEDKFKYIELIKSICHAGHVQYEDYIYSSKFIEGAIVTHLHRKSIIAPNKPVGSQEAMRARDDSGDEGFVGAFVKHPYPGLYEDIYSLDLESLYPSIIMSLNISPETKISKVLDFDMDAHLQKKLEHYDVLSSGVRTRFTYSDFMAYIESANLHLSSNGILYTANVKGIIPEILEDWFSKRKVFKKEMVRLSNDGKKVESEYYDRRQHAQKIILNSVYGALGLPVFRFYDLDNAAAVTTSGQDVIRTSAKYMNLRYAKLGVAPRDDVTVERHEKYFTAMKNTPTASEMKFLIDPKNHCIYADTDSLYMSATELLHQHPDFPTWDIAQRTAHTIPIAREAESDLNAFYVTMAKKLFNISSGHRFVIKGESIACTGLWLAKKRYALLKVYDLETSEDVDFKFKPTGLDVVRSSFPMAFKTFAQSLLIKVLHRESKASIDAFLTDFNTSLPTLDPVLLARNTSIKNLSKYDDGNPSFQSYVKGTTAHGKACLSYNRLLKHHNIQNAYELIKNGDKIKYVYLKKNPFHIEFLAFKGFKDPEVVTNLIKDYIDYDIMFDKELKTKVEDVYAALGWGILPTDINTFAQEFFDFL